TPPEFERDSATDTTSSARDDRHAPCKLFLFRHAISNNISTLKMSSLRPSAYRCDLCVKKLIKRRESQRHAENAELLAPVSSLLQTAEVIPECRKDRRAVTALHVAKERIGANEAVAWIFRNRTDDPTENTVVNRPRPQLNQPLLRQTIDLRRTGQDRRAVEVTSIRCRDRIELLATFGRESLRREHYPNSEPH